MHCKFCSREIKNAGSLAAHQKSCKSNPDRVDHPHSPNAGAKKGSTSWAKGKVLGPSKYYEEKYPNEAIFVENGTYARHSLKRRILRENLVPHECAVCGLGPHWQGEPMPLILDHKNGVNNDNRLENLRFVCSNCDTQLETYKSKNRSYKQTIL